MTGKTAGVAGIVGGVMNLRKRRETYDQHQKQTGRKRGVSLDQAHIEDGRNGLNQHVELPEKT
jgi:hypothetical protein